MLSYHLQNQTRNLEQPHQFIYLIHRKHPQKLCHQPHHATPPPCRGTRALDGHATLLFVRPGVGEARVARRLGTDDACLADPRSEGKGRWENQVETKKNPQLGRWKKTFKCWG